jgi:hypothetical protein
MKCKQCNKEFTNPYINTWYCSKDCENKNKGEIPDFMKDIFKMGV